MEKLLIPNNIKVSEQFVLMNKFRQVVTDAWVKSHPKDLSDRRATLEFIEEKFGVRCRFNEEGTIIEPRIVDEKKSFLLNFY